MYDKLIDVIREYIYVSGVEDFKNFLMSYNCSKILLGEKDFKFDYKYRKKYDFKKIDFLVEGFFKDLNPTYLDYYRLRKGDGSFIFEKDLGGSGYSTFNDEGKREIYVGLTGYIEDCYAIVHELFHDMNAKEDTFETIGRYFFTECLSMLGEFLLSDYLIDKNVVGRKNVIELDLYYLRKKALEVNFNLELIKEYFGHGSLNDDIVNGIIESYPVEYRRDIMETIVLIEHNKWVTLEEEQTYVVSSLAATYMYDRIKSNKKYLKELFDLNEVLNDYSLDNVLDYLDIEYGDFDLTDKSYFILRDKYKKFIKRW